MARKRLTMKRCVEICEALGWRVFVGKTDVEIESWSPLGENLICTFGKDDFVNNVVKYAEDFDADEHAQMWVENWDTVAGVPHSVRALIDDAEAIQDMLDELAEALQNNKVEVGENA